LTISKRTYQRHDVALSVEILHEGQSYPGNTRNLSLGGMFILCAAEIPFGALLHVTFTIATSRHPIITEAVVRWTEPGVGVGVQFTGLRAGEVWALQQLFAGHYGPA